MGHKVKTFHWHKGHLRVQERYFASLDDAKSFLSTEELDVFEAKIYDDGDELVHVHVDAATDSYA